MKISHLKMALAMITFTVLLSCASSPVVKIDQVPMYGGIDRSANPRLAEGDKQFIDKVINEYGDKRTASEKFVDQGFRFYHGNNMSNAMKRFNQAWLLDDSNPEVYHGFASVLLDQEKDCEAVEMMKRSKDLDWGSRWMNRSGFYTDFGYLTAMCAGYGSGLSQIEKNELAVQSMQWFKQAAAEKLVNQQYLLDKWWQAKYHLRNYAGAWEKVIELRELGGTPDSDMLPYLIRQMPEPGK